MLTSEIRRTGGNGEIFKTLRKTAGLSQQELSQLLGVHQTAVSQWECGRTQPDVTCLKRMSELYSVTLDTLIGGSLHDMPQDAERFARIKNRIRGEQRRIPILGSVQAGVPVSAVEDIIGYVELPDDCHEPDEYFALRVRGDSMEPRFMEGDTVLIRKQEDADNGDIIVAMAGDEATIKQLKKRDDGILLVPFNRDYEPLFFTYKDIVTLPVRILGKVTELRARF